MPCLSKEIHNYRIDKLGKEKVHKQKPTNVNEKPHGIRFQQLVPLTLFIQSLPSCTQSLNNCTPLWFYIIVNKVIQRLSKFDPIWGNESSNDRNRNNHRIQMLRKNFIIKSQLHNNERKLSNLAQAYSRQDCIFECLSGEKESQCGSQRLGSNDYH